MKTTIWSTEVMTRENGDVAYFLAEEEAIAHATHAWRYLATAERRETEITVSRYDDIDTPDDASCLDEAIHDMIIEGTFPENADWNVVFRELVFDFFAGESRHGSYGVNYLIERRPTLRALSTFYAECRVPDDGEISEDYGYYALVDEIRRQAEAAGIPVDFLVFPYDEYSDSQLEDDARADVEVKGW